MAPANSLSEPARRLQALHVALAAAAAPSGVASPQLLAVSKLQTANAIADLAAAGQRAFGENYVQEARTKQAVLNDQTLEWHLIGHLQSNKARQAAQTFDWIQSVDRPALVEALARHRPASLAPLNLLIQVNIDDEPGKHGAAPEHVATLADAIAADSRLRLRGLMAIPTPANAAARRAAFAAMRRLFDGLAARFDGVDTLSMGMSEDYAMAIEQGATMVRIGSALFGPGPAQATAQTDMRSVP